MKTQLLMFGTALVLSTPQFANSQVLASAKLRQTETRTTANLKPVDLTIKGKVFDETGKNLPGASITLKGSMKGTSTDSNGNFSITVPDTKGSLVISYIGYLTQEIMLGNQTNLNIRLLTDNNILEEVVVVGYGTVKRKDLVSSIGTAKAKDFGEVTVTNAEQLLQGKLAGVQVVNNNGLPGQGARIFIRGTGTFTNPDPLYVIDGMPGDINSVPWQDIEDISVLKDAGSTAIYGARAANGVVIVTTKRGKSGIPRISYNFQYGVANIRKKFELLGAKDYVDLVKEMTNGDIPASSIIGKPESLVTRTDWQEQMLQPGPQMNHYLNISGGAEKTTYNVSLGYENQDGIFRPYNFQRTRLRFALEENLGRVKLGQTVNSSYYVYSGSTFSLDQAIRMPPYAPVEDPNNLGGYYNVTPNVDLQDAQNPTAWINNRSSVSRGLSITAQVYGEIKIADWLKFRTQAQIGFNANNNWDYRKEFRSGNLFYAREINEGSNFNITPFIENFVTIDKTFGIHKINAIGGVTYANGGRYRGLNVSGSNLTNDEIQNIGAAGTRSVSGSYASTNTNAQLSYFARVQYDLNEKYLFTASWRRDYSPNFGLSNRYGDFPAFGAAWKISEEPFMKTLPFISDMKIRASWGKTGNDRIGAFLTSVNVFRGYAPASPGYSLGVDKAYNLGSTLSSVPNPDLRWEGTTQVDMGVDISVLANKLTFSFDYYNRNSSGLLLRVLLPQSTGLGNAYEAPSIPLNAASAVNKGVEMAVTYRGRKKDLRYGANLNMSFNDNEVTSLGTQGSVPIRGGSFSDAGAITKTDVGTPIGAFFGYRMDHVAIDAADVNKYNEIAKGKGLTEYQAGLQPGDIIFKDLDGNGVVDEKDQEFLGSPIPKIQYGGNLDLGYKNFDLVVGLTGIAGVELINSSTYYLEGTNKVFNHGVGVLDRWKKPGDIAKNPKANQGANGNLNLRSSDRFLENGSYLRVRNITLGYNLNKIGGIVSKAVKTVRVYTTLQNFITITKYTGLDPEVLAEGGDVLFGRGVGGYTPPIPKIWLVGINIGF